jgi:hypothetical protein
MIASTTRVRSSVGRLLHTLGVFTSCILSPPGIRHSLEGFNQLCNGSGGKDGKFPTWLLREIGTANRYKTDLAW